MGELQDWTAAISGGLRHEPGASSTKLRLVTGAASGIGRATAELFVAEGATVVLRIARGSACRDTQRIARGEVAPAASAAHRAILLM